MAFDDYSTGVVEGALNETPGVWARIEGRGVAGGEAGVDEGLRRVLCGRAQRRRGAGAARAWELRRDPVGRPRLSGRAGRAGGAGAGPERASGTVSTGSIRYSARRPKG